MRWHQKVAYSFGHIQNDLCAAMWFSLLLVFLQYVVLIPEKQAGYLLLWGQIVDAISTPLVGYESDRISGCCGLPKRKSWHLLGTVAVSMSFPFVFLRCLACSGPSEGMWGQVIYYAPFIAIFQFGWSCVQISHMALMSQLTHNPSVQTELSGLRNAGTLLARVVVFCSGWGFFGPDTGSTVGPADQRNFMLLMVTVMVIGVFFSSLFHLFLREVDASAQENGLVVGRSSGVKRMEWYEWLLEPQFYMVALLYMLSRLIVNVSGTYWPFYVINTLHMNKTFMVIIPLIVNVTGFFMSLLMRPISDRIGRKLPMLLALLVTVGGCAWMWAIRHFSLSSLQVIGPSVLIGIGGSALIVTSLAMTTDMIGSRSESGAFVFGSMSLTDKLAGGVAVLLVQLFCPCASGHADTVQTANYYYIVIVYVIAGFCAVQCILLLVMWPQKLGQLRRVFPSPDSSASIGSVDHSESERLIASINQPSAYMTIGTTSAGGSSPPTDVTFRTHSPSLPRGAFIT